MDRLKDLLEKIPFSLLFAAYIGWMGWSFYNFNNSAESPRIQKQVELERVKKETDEIRNRIKQAEEFYKTLDQKRIELRTLAQQLDEMRATLTEQLDISYFIKMVVTEATKVGLTVSGIRPTTQQTGEFYAEQTFELTFHAVYVQLLVFLERLATVERIVRIESLDVHPTGSSLSSYVELGGTLQLKAYRYIGTRADQLVKAEPAPVVAPKPVPKPKGLMETLSGE